MKEFDFLHRTCFSVGEPLRTPDAAAFSKRIAVAAVIPLPF